MSDRPSYGDVTAEYLALRREAAMVRGRRELVWVRGGDAVSFLDGLLSQDIPSLEPGSVSRSLLLSPRGKLRATLWVLRGEERVGLIADRGVGASVVEDLNRFSIRVDAVVDDPLPLTECWGPSSVDALDRAGLPAPQGWSDGGGTLVASIPLLELPRYALSGPGAAELAEEVSRWAGDLAVDAVRVEAGEPVMGVDIDERTIPQESGLVPETVSFSKGCFLGQELVARIDSRGRVNRHLRGVVIGSNVLPPPGAEVTVGGDSVGAVTSVAESLSLRAPIALAMIRREAEPPVAVDIRWDRGQVGGQLRTLPLDDLDTAEA